MIRFIDEKPEAAGLIQPNRCIRSKKNRLAG